MPLATENLYLGAYALSHGAELKGVVVTRSNGRQTAVFQLDCPWIHKLADEYYAGTAVVNLAEYREKLEELKDRLFGALRSVKNETERRLINDAHDATRKGARRAAPRSSSGR